MRDYENARYARAFRANENARGCVRCGCENALRVNGCDFRGCVSANFRRENARVRGYARRASVNFRVNARISYNRNLYTFFVLILEICL